ncbi:hypothetical protein BJQ90_03789 [Arthrobacter sp. SO3]|nr:hypothetical protein [Arthrobacter sp. SO3]
MDDSADLPLVDPPAARAEEERRAGGVRGEGGPAPAQPVVDGERGRQSVGHSAFLVALAKHPQGPAVGIEVVHVEAGQLADPDAGGVQQFNHGPVPQRHGPSLGGSRLRIFHEPKDLLLVQHSGQGLFPLRCLQPQGGVRLDEFLTDGPGGEGPGGGGAPGQGGAGHAPFALRSEPAPQGAELQPGKILDSFGGRMLQEAADVGEVGAHRVGRASPLRLQVAAEALGCGGQAGRDLLGGHSPTLAGFARRSRIPAASRWSARSLRTRARPAAGTRPTLILRCLTASSLHAATRPDPAARAGPGPPAPNLRSVPRQR